MWTQNYTPVAGSLAMSALAAAIPIVVLLLMLAVFRRPSWQAALAGLGSCLLTSTLVFGMPAQQAFAAVSYGAAFGLLPIGWIVFSSIVLYRLTVETGNFEILKNSIGRLSPDRRLQALLIAFAFGAFVEGAAGFGSPVAVASAMLTGLGFSPFYAAGICLLANTAPVAFGSIGIPVITLAGTTGLPLQALSAKVGQICAPLSLFVPSYLILVIGGWRALRGVLPAAVLCGATFAGFQFYVSNYLGPELVDVASSLSSMAVLVVLMKVWKPKDTFQFAGEEAKPVEPLNLPAARVIKAWSPYLLLVFFVVLWGRPEVKAYLNTYSINFGWPGLHNLVERVAPAVKTAAPYAARYDFNYLAASGTACMLAAVAACVVLGVSPLRFLRILGLSLRQLALPLVTICGVVGLAFLMNYSGATATLGLAFAATGVMFPLFSALLGWLGVFLTGSDTSANALFGNLQVITAEKLNLDPVLMASSNSSGGVMGKMISLQSIAVAAAATGMSGENESQLFRFTLKHSVFLALVIGCLVMVYAYSS